MATKQIYSENKKNTSSYPILSPLPKPDFSSIEKKENSVNYVQKGSYKKPKSFVPESPIKSPTTTFFTPNKKSSNFSFTNGNTCRKLDFTSKNNDSTAEINKKSNHFNGTDHFMEKDNFTKEPQPLKVKDFNNNPSKIQSNLFGNTKTTEFERISEDDEFKENKSNLFTKKSNCDSNSDALFTYSTFKLTNKGSNIPNFETNNNHKLVNKTPIFGHIKINSTNSILSDDYQLNSNMSNEEQRSKSNESNGMS